MNKKILSILILLIAVSAYAADTVIRQDNIIFGKPDAATDKTIQFNTGDGASNVRLKVDDSRTSTFNTNSFTIGDGASSNKTFGADIGAGANNPSIFFDATESAWKFSNDGSLVKKIGSGTGSGGGDNFLGELNGDFEEGTGQWTFTGTGSFAVTTTDQIGNSTSIQSATVDANGSATLVSALIDVPLGAQSEQCSADFRYQWVGGVPADADAVIVNGSDQPVVNFPDFQATTGTEVKKLISPIFDCSVATQLQLKITFTSDQPLMKIDDFFVGSGKNQFQIDQASFIGGITHPTGDSNCLPVQNGHNVGFREFLTDSDCQVWDAIGENVTVTGAAGVPNFTMNDLPEGSYIGYVDVIGGVTTNTDGEYICQMAMDTGAVRVGNSSWTSSANNGIASTPNGNFTFTFDHSGGDRSFSLRIAQEGGTASRCSLRMDADQISINTIKIYKMSGTPSRATTIETTGKYVEAALVTSGSNINLPTGTSAFPSISYTTGAIQNYGTLEAEAACLNVDGGGPDCNDEGVNEYAGFVFTPHVAGVWEVCADFTQESRAAAAIQNGVGTDWYLAEVTTNGASTLRRSKKIVRYTNFTAAANQLTKRETLRLCGLFDFPVISKRRFELQLNQAATGAGAVSNTLNVGGGATAFTFQTVFSAYPVSEQKPTPVFTDLQNTLNDKVGSGGTGNTILKSCYINNVAGVPQIGGDIALCDWVQSVTDNGPGDYTVNFVSGTFVSSPPNCQVTPGAQNPTTGANVSLITLTQTAIRVFVENVSNNGIDNIVTITCHGR